MNFLNRYKRGLAWIIFSLILLFPIKSFANDAYFFQVLIDDQKFQYMGSIVEDNVGYFDMKGEANHLEIKSGNFTGLPMNVIPNTPVTLKDPVDNSLNIYDNTGNGGRYRPMTFTYPPVAIKTKILGAALNNATSTDVQNAYLAQETLMPGLNDALKILNGGKPFSGVKPLIDKGQELGTVIQKGKGTVGNYNIVVGKKALPGDPQKGFASSDYLYIQNKNDSNEVYEFIYRVPKGYVPLNSKDKRSYEDAYKGDTPYITWNQVMFQADNVYYWKGYTVKTGQEILKPDPLEQAVVGMMSNLFNQLRNILGLYNINDLVFNDGIRGSQAWTHGIMSKDWSDKALAYHWLFQGLAWSIITFAIVKNLLQRNLATINSAMRISLMESIQNLVITGFLLANAIPVINMFMFLNAKLVAVFANTAPDFANLSGENNYSNMLGGIIIQFFYMGLSIYLNFVYIMRAITVAILIATAPMFIVTIAFGGKWKQLFNTWMRELTGNIFLQSFHAFMLSFFFAISTSSRGIEGMVVMMALIPMTEFFRSLVMGSGGGMSHALGMQSMAQAGSLVGGALAMTKGKAKPNGSNINGGNSRESSTSSANDSGMNNLAGNSDKIKNNSASMNQRQRLNSTQQALNKRELPAHVAEIKNNLDSSTPEQLSELSRYTSTDGFQTQPEGKIQKAINMAQSIPEKAEKRREGFDNSIKGNLTYGVAKGALGGAKAVAGVAQMAIGLGTAMAVPGMAREALRGVSAGKELIQSGVTNMGNSVKHFGSMIPESTKTYATTLPNGDMQVHRSANALKEQGIVGATMEVDGESQVAKYTYNPNIMSNGDVQNLKSAYTAFASGDQAQKQHYMDNGIQDVAMQGNKYIVKYNQTGMEQLGIKSVQTIAQSGKNPRIVETKRPNDPTQTRMTLNIPAYTPPPQPQPQGNGNGNTV